MSVGWLVAGLVLAFVVLDVLVLVHLFRRSARRAAALRIPSQRIPAGRPRRGAFDVDDALTWTASGASPAAGAEDHSLTWTDDLDGYADLSRGASGTLASIGDGADLDQSRPSASSKAE